jgi:methylmalonyl-CoA epimerase
VTAVRLHHVGIAVPDLAAAARVYREALGLPPGVPEHVERDAVAVLVVPAGGVLLELLQPLDDRGPVARFLARRGPGVHHVAFAVPDVTAALERARAAGVTPIDEAPRPGAHGWRVAFLHPRDLHGVLVELVEDPGA